MKENKNKLAKFVYYLHLFWVVWAILYLPLIFLFKHGGWIVGFFLIVNIFVWIVFRECPLNRWECKALGLEYDKHKQEGTFLSRLYKKFFNLDVSRKKAVLINRIYIGGLLLVVIIKLIFEYT